MPSRRRVICGAGSLAAAGLAGCTTGDPADRAASGDDPDTEWPQPGGTERYDCYRSEAVAPRESPSERWTAETSMPMARPIVADGRVLLFTSNRLEAYDLDSGEAAWRVGGDDDEWDVRTSPIVVDGTAYVGVALPDGVLAVDLADGERIWHVELPDSPTTASVVDRRRERLVIGTEAGLAGVTVDGDPNWTRETFSPVSALSSWGDEVYAGTEGGELYAFYDPDDLEGMWRRQLDGSVVQVALLNGDGVVVSTFGGAVDRRDDSATGAARWSHDALGSRGFVAAGNTYAVGRGLTSIHTRTGERHWTLDLDLKAPPAGAGDTIYTGGDGFVAAYAMGGGIGLGDDRARVERWRYEVDGGVFEGVSVADGAVFATASNGDGATLYALE